MTITVDDVKLLKSQRLTDEADGGGRATGEAIVDNEINNLFPDISRLDRTLGRINLRKVFAGVITENQDRYLGAHAIITRKPGDDLVHALLFNTGSQTDERAEALSAVSGIPVFLLMGRSVGGLNSSGKAEMEGWYARIASMQNDILRKPFDKLCGLILGSMNVDAEYKIEFCPLSVPSEAEEADTELKKAQAEKTRMETDSGYAALGVVDPAELRKSEHVTELYPEIDPSLDNVQMPEGD